MQRRPVTTVDLRDPRLRRKLEQTLWTSTALYILPKFSSVRDAIYSSFGELYIDRLTQSVQYAHQNHEKEPVDEMFMRGFVQQLYINHITWQQLNDAIYPRFGRFLADLETECIYEFSEIPSGYNGIWHTKFVDWHASNYARQQIGLAPVSIKAMIY